MKITKVAAVYFSATGNTKQVAEALAQCASAHFGVFAQRYDFTVPANREKAVTFDATTFVSFGVPVYAGRVPNKVLPIIQELFHGDKSPACAMVTYGNRSYDNGLIELCDVLKKNGFSVTAAAAFPAIHAFSQRLAPGRPDSRDMELLRQFAGKTAQRLLELSQDEAAAQTLSVPGTLPLHGYYTPLGTDGRPAVFLKAKPKTRMEQCDLCGLCSQVCPMGSIRVSNTVETIGICIKCHACIHRCPRRARYMDDPAFLSHVKMLEQNYTGYKEPEFFMCEI